MFLFPAASHVEKEGTFTQTQRMLQWREKAVEPPGDARSELWFFYHLGRMVRERLAGSTDERDRPVLDLAWDYPLHGDPEQVAAGWGEPSAEAVLQEINGYEVATGRPLSSLHRDEGRRLDLWAAAGSTPASTPTASTRPPGGSPATTSRPWPPSGAGPGR